jgi:hypothetical protein|tara:strand:- start:1233 stop:1463 length:231 start_codon:yes stop_codon:yes gene_type:complete
MTRRATEFLIWRAGESVNWDCTPQEIADEIGMSFQTVNNVCKQRGWSVVRGRVGNFDRYAVDAIIAHPNMAGGGAN